MLRRCAQRYAADFGLRVLPIRPGTKVPDLADWPREATRDPARITDWWSNGHAGCGIGIATGATSGIFVLDVDDNRADKRGSDTLAELMVEHGVLPETPTVLTPSGGCHYYWRWPGFALKESLGAWLDIRGAGRQVVAPPSVHPNGHVYTWEEGSRLSQVPIAEAPAWMLELLRLDTAPTNDSPERNERKGPFNAVLDAVGYTLDGTDRKGDDYWTRPDKDPREGHSAVVYGDLPARAVVYTTTGTNPDYVGHALHSPRELARMFVKDEVWLAGVLGMERPSTNGSEAPPPKDGRVGGRNMAPVSLDVIYDTADPEYDWLVPNLLERGDRVIVTGDEGYGKSTLLRQFAFGAVRGENTFGGLLDRHDECKVLIVDLENTIPQVRREFDKLFALHGGRSNVAEALARLHLTCRPGGMALDVKGPDRDELRGWLNDVKPDVLVIGPLYKMHEGDPNKEEYGRPLSLFLDGLRQDFGVTVLIEAHAPHGQKRPYGWSGWKRWPEFGFHLATDGTFSAWRGGRDAERVWPTRLRRDGKRWLWTPDSQQPLPAPPDDELRRHANRRAIRRVLVEARDHRQGPVTKRQLLERANDGPDTTRKGLLAALGDLEAEELVREEEGEVVRSNGKTYPVTGYVVTDAWA